MANMAGRKNQLEKVHCPALPYHAEVAGCEHDVGLGQILQPMCALLIV